MESRFRGARRPRMDFDRVVGRKSEGVNYVPMEAAMEKESAYYKDLKKLKTSDFPSLGDPVDPTEQDDSVKKMTLVKQPITDQTSVTQPITSQTSLMLPIPEKTTVMHPITDEMPVMLPATEDLELDFAPSMVPSLPESDQLDTELKSKGFQENMLAPDLSLLGANGMLPGWEKILLVPDLPPLEEEMDRLENFKKSESQMANTLDFTSLQQPSDSTRSFRAESEDLFVSVQTKKAFTKKPRASTVSSVPREDLNYNFVQHELRQLDHFVPNIVQYTTSSALTEFVDCLPHLVSGTHGCIVQEGYRPDGEQYMENVHFVTEKNLGRGSFGNVDLAVDSSSGKKLVRKQIEKSQIQNGEIIIPLNLDSEHVTKIIGLIQRQTEHSVKMELLLEYAGSSLNIYLLQEGKVLTSAQIWGLTKQSLKGLTHLHNYGMIHLDFKPENLCIQEVNGELRLKITDFGSAKLPYEDITFIGWTPEYMAPESCQYFLQKMQGIQFAYVLNQEDITGKVDVFALFLVIGYMYGKKHVLLSLITKGRGSYKGMTAEEKNWHQTQLIIMMATNGADVDALINDNCDLDMRDLLKKMSHPMRDRVTAREALDIVERRELIQERLERERELKHQQFNQQLLRRQTEFHYTTPEINNLCLPATVMPEITRERSVVKDKLREKLMPYKKNQNLPESPRTPMTPVEEMQRLQIRIGTSRGKHVQEQGQRKPSLQMVVEEQTLPITETARASNMTTRPSVEQSRPALVVTTPSDARNMPAPALFGVQTTSPDYGNFIDLKTQKQECSEPQGNIPKTVFDF